MAFKMRGWSAFTKNYDGPTATRPDPRATRSLKPGEGKPYAGGIHTTMWKAASNLGKKIYSKLKK